MASIPLSIVAAAKASMASTRIPASTQIAQWALESGWGAHSPGNNPFGMKPRKGMNDPQQMLSTHEIISGVDKQVMQPFRVFASINAAFLAHAQLISQAPVYAPAMACLPSAGQCPTDDAVNAFINLLAPKYATDPLYASKLKSIIQSNGLRNFDV